MKPIFEHLQTNNCLVLMLFGYVIGTQPPRNAFDVSVQWFWSKPDY